MSITASSSAFPCFPSSFILVGFLNFNFIERRLSREGFMGRRGRHHVYIIEYLPTSRFLILVFEPGNVGIRYV